MTDLGPLIDLPGHPSSVAVGAVDRLSWALPAASALLSAWAGGEALEHADQAAALLGIVASMTAAAGIMFTNWASRIRDHRLAEARAVADLGLGIADRVDSRTSPQF